MKTFIKIIMVIALVASFVSFSYGQEPKVKNTFKEGNEIKAVFDNNMEMSFWILEDAPNQVTVNGCIHVSGPVTIPSQIEMEGFIYHVTQISRRDILTNCNGDGFSGCTGLTSITIPNSVTMIGQSAFDGCTSLTSITIPNSVTYIGDYAFSGCTGLSSVNIPNSVTTIGGYAFNDCTGLSSINIPNSVTSIYAPLFSGCKKLTSIIVADGNPYYDSRGNCNAVIETATNTLIAACNNTIIPNSVTSIGNLAFSGCTGLSSVAIPNSVTSIGWDAFSGCTGLSSVTIPNSVTSIDESAFSGCTGLSSVTISNSVTSIEASTFSGCTGLTSVTIPNSVTIIGACAFEDCTSLTSVSIPNSVTSIGMTAFSGCSRLTSITIPSSVTSIGDYAFECCKELTSANIKNPNTRLDYDKVFRYCDKLKRSYTNSSQNTTYSKDFSWIVGTWACDMGSYGTVVVKFDGDGTSGDCAELQYGSYKYGTYRVEDNTLRYKLNGESVTTTIEIQSNHRLHAGEGYYYHKK